MAAAALAPAPLSMRVGVLSMDVGNGRAHARVRANMCSCGRAHWDAQAHQSGAASVCVHAAT
eukprot:6109148-Pleurochrysis_carterae.AAC.1